MRLTFFYAAKGYEQALGPALIEGAARHGDVIEMRPLDAYAGPEADGGMVCGVVKREVIYDHQRLGVPLVYLDKGFIRERAVWRRMNMPAWWRMCWNAVHPTAYLPRLSYPQDRLLMQDGWRLSARRAPGDHIVIAGSSAKYHETMGLPHPTIWARETLEAIRRWSDAPVIYRPKPSWADAEPIEGAIFDHGSKTTFDATLARASCVVTWGSIASVDAIMAGVPCVVLGNAPARPVSATTISAVAKPWWAPERERLSWAANLAYCHFRPQEIADGVAWRILKEQLHAV